MITEHGVGKAAKTRGERSSTRFPPVAPADIGRARALAFSGDPLMRAAAPLLMRAAGLVAGTGSDRRGDLLQLLRRFAEDARMAGLSQAEIKAARLPLDAFVEVLSGPASKATVARFYATLETLANDPVDHRSLLRLYHACLALGFDGLDLDRGEGGDPDCVRAHLYRRLRGPVPATLAPAASPAPKGRRLIFTPSSWLLVLPLTACAAFGWWSLSEAAANKALAVAGHMERPVAAESEIVHRGPPPDDVGPSLIDRVSAALAPEIQARTLSVVVGTDGALVIRVFGNGMFPIDGDSISARHRAVIDRIGGVLANERGSVLVVGNLDDLFAPTDRFPTPETLTWARAEVVRHVLEGRLGPRRLAAEGRGQRDPIASGGATFDRTLNRRIDIRLYPL